MARIRFLGHAAFEAELGGKTIYFDPWLNAKPKESERLVPPTTTPDKIRKADAVFVSHEHFDHCDSFDIGRIYEKTFAHVLGPEPVLAKLDNIPPRSKMAAFQWDSFSTWGLDVTVTAAKHPQSQYPVGFVVSAGGASVYFAGDTYEFFEMNRINADVALLPIGGTYTMDSFSAVKALKFLKCRIVVPMHYDTFDNIKANPQDFAKRVRENTKVEPVVLNPGESFDF